MSKTPEERFRDGRAFAAALRDPSSVVPAAAGAAALDTAATQVIGTGAVPRPVTSTTPVAGPDDEPKQRWWAVAAARPRRDRRHRGDHLVRRWPTTTTPARPTDPDVRADQRAVPVADHAGPRQRQVNESDYVGRPVGEVVDELQNLGLNVERNELDNPGGEQQDIVDGVNPSGTLQEGDTVTVSYWGPPPAEPTRRAHRAHAADRADRPTTAAETDADRPADHGRHRRDRTRRPDLLVRLRDLRGRHRMTTGQHLIGGRYELGELLGRGGMAEVRKGTDTRLGRVVAIKRLRTDLASDATFQARFRREAQSSASLNHPAIVAVYDTGEEPATDGSGVSQPYIVMEYVAGRTLREILREGRKILPERALEITSGVLSALDYSHRAGIIHRDIKPGNVMLTPSGDVKVMDFGIARAISDASSTMTQTAAVVGTAQYLSPEQARGETVDSRSDVYSAGCLLYELLTGRPPFVGDSPVAVAYQHVREPAMPPSDHDTDLPAEVDAIVMKSLAKRVEDRYQSAAAMRSDIERYLAGRPVHAVVPPPPPPDRCPARTTRPRPPPPRCPRGGQPAQPDRC